MKYGIIVLFVATTALVPNALGAQPWTGIPGAAVPDESALDIYQAETSLVTYNASGSIAPIILRYTLTDTTATGAPSWSTLELNAYDPSPNSSVRAQILRVVSGGTFTVANCFSGDASMYTKWQCPFSTPIDFNAGNTYAVVITISRSDVNVVPRFGGVRIY